MCQRCYLVVWQLVCLRKEAIKMSLTKTKVLRQKGCWGKGLKRDDRMEYTGERLLVRNNCREKGADPAFCVESRN